MWSGFGSFGTQIVKESTVYESYVLHEYEAGYRLQIYLGLYPSESDCGKGFFFVPSVLYE